MSLLVTGSIGIDTVKTPFGRSEESIGGSAVFFSYSASFFNPVRFLGVVGKDCPFDLAKIFKGRDISLEGLEVREDSKTFRWHGSYEGSMNEANTDMVELNVLAEEPAKMPDSYKDSDFIFLANTHPAIQMQILEETYNPKFVAADTMNLWIETERESLKELLERINCLILNEDEARQLTGQYNLISAGEDIMKMGPDVVIIKKGEHGSIMLDATGDCFVLPAYPTKIVIDPTGAGDAFAGGLMGYIAKSKKVDNTTLRQAIAYGTACSSFTIGDFSLHGIKAATLSQLDERVEILRKATLF